MKKFLVLALITILFQQSFSQEVQTKPLSQSEYVKLLYGLQNSPKRLEQLVEAVRKRGISFVLNDGLRGLTRTKSANNQELLRALEESERRRQDPTTVLPSEKEIQESLVKTRQNTLQAVEDMPDFVVKQLINRGVAYAGTNNFRSLDRLIVAVSYLSTGKEEYKILSINGVEQSNPQLKGSYEEAGGTTSTGEFVTVLAKIFDPETQTKFEALDTDVIRQRKAIIFKFEATKEKAQQAIISFGYVADTAITGIKGKIWIDRETFRVLRIESTATEIPADFPVKAASRTIDYDWATIAEQRYLLPLSSEIRLTSRYDRQLYETRNQIRFKDYKKFGSEVKILDDDVVIEEKPKDN